MNDMIETATAPARITEPGIYRMSSDEYHGSPCDGLALGSTGARTLVAECPAAFRYAVPEIKEEFDIGNATHLLVLEPAQFKARIGIVAAKDWRTKDAKAARDDIRADGRIPLLAETVDMIQAMRDTIFADPVAGVAFRDGEAEQSMFWRDPEYGFWCKTRPDWLPAHRRYLVDVKTSTSANPAAFARAIRNYGYHQQAAWYLGGVEAIYGARPERFAFVVVSKKPPHLVSTCWLGPQSIQWGGILNRRARGLFAWCMKHDRWPSYQPEPTGRPSAFDVDLDAWAMRDLQLRHEAGEFEPPVMEMEKAA